MCTGAALCGGPPWFVSISLDTAAGGFYNRRKAQRQAAENVREPAGRCGDRMEKHQSMHRNGGESLLRAGDGLRNGGFMKKAIFVLLVVILLGVMSYSLWQILGITAEYRGGTDSYDELGQFLVIPETKPVVQETTGENPAEETEAPTEAEILWPEVDFDALAQVNDDVVGWIYVPGTAINYPVVQGSDNDYYLRHLFNGKRNSSGCIFLDFGAEGDFTSMNSVLHGHHMKNGSMFAAVCKYKTQSFFDEHPTGLLMTPGGNYEIRFFAGYVCSTESDAWDIGFAESDYAAWLDKRIRKSYFDSGIVPTTADRVITLSTCSYEYDDARFVIHGVLVPAE